MTSRSWPAAAPAGPREPGFIPGDRKKLLLAAPPLPDAAGGPRLSRALLVALSRPAATTQRRPHRNPK